MNGLLQKYKALPVQARASIWFIFAVFLRKGTALITTPIFTRLLTEAEYGQYNVFTSWHNILSVFVGLCLYYGMFSQGLVKFEENRERFVSSMQGLSLTLTAAWTVVFFLFRGFWTRLFSLSETQLLSMLCLIWTGALASYWSMQERMELRYKALVALTVAEAILKSALGIFLVLHTQDKVTARILGMVAVDVCAYSWIFFRHMKRGRTFFDKYYWRYAILFCIPLIPHYLAQFVLIGSDRIMISRLVSDDAAGIYSLAYSAAQIMTIFSSALTQTIEPWLYKTLKEGVWERFAGIAYPAMALVAALNIALIAFAPEIIAIIAPPSYYDAIWAIPPVVMSVFFNFTYLFFVVFEFYYEKTLFIAAATVASAILNVVLNSFCIPVWGYCAAGYTTLFCYVVYALAHYLFMTSICRRERPDIWVYHPGILLAMSGALMGLGFTFLALYRHTAARYALLLALALVAWLRRAAIVAYVKRLVAMRKK